MKIQGFLAEKPYPFEFVRSMSSDSCASVSERLLLSILIVLRLHKTGPASQCYIYRQHRAMQRSNGSNAFALGGIHQNLEECQHFYPKVLANLG